MIIQSEIIQMEHAYGQLYEIENLLRQFIKNQMEKEYGPNWFHIAPRIVLKRPPSKQFEKLLFHEYERIYLRTYQKAFESISDKFINHLHSLYPIRNKIAHHHKLSDEEMDIVNNSCTYLKMHIELTQLCLHN
jgi:hypothetical protein